MAKQLWSKGLAALAVAALALISAALPAAAVEPIRISRDNVALDLSGAAEIYLNQGENFQVSTAPGPDGIVRRIEVEANGERSRGDWAVFALANSTDQQLDRLIVAIGTVKKHINNIYGKLDARSRTQALARARELNLL